MIYTLYGQPASGKTTLGKLLAEYLDSPFVIDGDEFRKMFTNKNYGRKGREKNIRNANTVATYLNKQGHHVVICLVNPYKQLRRELNENNRNEVIEILLRSSRGLRREYHVEDFEDGDPDCIIRTDQKTEDSWNYLKALLGI